MYSKVFTRSSCRVARWSAIPLVSFFATVMLAAPLRAGTLDGTANGTTDWAADGTGNGAADGPQPVGQSGYWWQSASGTVVTWSGSSTYSGPTTISQDKLVVDGWLGDSAVGVNGGTLGGTGHLGSVAVNAGGHLAPGDLNTGALVIAGGVDFQGGELDLVGTGKSITSVSIAGNLSLKDDPTLDVTGSLSRGPYTIASYGGTLSGKFNTLDIPTGYTIDYGTGRDSSITLSAVPEPPTLALLGVAVILLVHDAWRRWRASAKSRERLFRQIDSARLVDHGDKPITDLVDASHLGERQRLVRRFADILHGRRFMRERKERTKDASIIRTPLVRDKRLAMLARRTVKFAPYDQIHSDSSC
ncbi:MAG: hypothetical protein ABSG53_02370 [Thermoguttaceae bacterium]